MIAESGQAAPATADGIAGTMATETRITRRGAGVAGLPEVLRPKYHSAPDLPGGIH
jgi:hypothetical protein